MTEISDKPPEIVLRDELSRGDQLILSAEQILRHLLANDDHSMFSDEIIARIRGMVANIERQLLAALADANGDSESTELTRIGPGPLADALSGNSLFLSHTHALALEWQLAESLQLRNAIDPVLSPLLQAMIAASDDNVAETAMNFLVSQARFVQQQRRMELPLNELPGDLFHTALLTWRACLDSDQDDAAGLAEKNLRAGFDEARSRLGLMSRLITAMGGNASSALSVSHAGTALFLTALSLASGQDRSLTILSTNERQMARLALCLRAAGLKPAAVEEQCAYLHPESMLPTGFEQLGADRAAAILSASDASFSDH